MDNQFVNTLSAKNISNGRLSCMTVSDNDLSEILNPSIARAGIVDAFNCHAAGNFEQPLKPYLYPKGRENMRLGGRYIAMPAYLGHPVHMAGIKWIGSLPANIERNLPRASGILILNDPETAMPVAIMECATLSARRTAAVASLSVHHLAPLEALRVAVIGSGPIAREVIFAIADFIDRLEEIRLFDIRRERADNLQLDVRTKTELSVNVYRNVQECVKRANVIITCTTGAENGYLKHDWLASPRLVVPLSLDDCEGDILLSSDKVVVDDWNQSNREQKLLHRLTQAGKFTRKDLYGEFGQIITSQLPGREGSENIYANFMGMAIEDIAVGARVFRAITEK